MQSHYIPLQSEPSIFIWLMMGNLIYRPTWSFKGALSGIRHFLATKSLLKIMATALFVLKIFQFVTQLFGHVEKRLNKKEKANFKTYDVAACETSCNIHNAKYLEK